MVGVLQDRLQLLLRVLVLVQARAQPHFSQNDPHGLAVQGLGLAHVAHVLGHITIAWRIVELHRRSDLLQLSLVDQRYGLHALMHRDALHENVAVNHKGELDFLAAGADLVPFDTLKDPVLPDVDGLFIGGGFPEECMAELEANQALRQAIRHAIESGMPGYAECGGLMYLARSITWNGDRREMVGAIPGDIEMHERPQGRGYVRMAETGNGPWHLTDDSGEPAAFAAHEFHYSSLENLEGEHRYAYRVLRGAGIDGEHDGIVIHNLLACYSHMRDTEQHHWAYRFVDFVRQHRDRDKDTADAL